MLQQLAEELQRTAIDCPSSAQAEAARPLEADPRSEFSADGQSGAVLPRFRKAGVGYGSEPRLTRRAEVCSVLGQNFHYPDAGRGQAVGVKGKRQDQKACLFERQEKFPTAGFRRNDSTDMEDVVLNAPFPEAIPEIPQQAMKSFLIFWCRSKLQLS
jgi:hypothetical protein